MNRISGDDLVKILMENPNAVVSVDDGSGFGYSIISKVEIEVLSDGQPALVLVLA